MSLRLESTFSGHDLWAGDLRRAAPLTRLRIQLVRFLVVVAWEFREHVLSLRAMALVYATLLALVPFLAVMFSVLKAFGVHDALGPFLDRFLAPLGPGGIEITRHVVDFVNNMRASVLGVVGIAGLFITVITLVEKIEDALNHIWRIRHSRSLARKFSDYLSVVLVGPVLVFTAFGLIASAQNYWLVQRALQLQLIGETFVLVAGRLMPFLFLCMAFTFLYRFVPHTYVPLRSALVGGTTAALLWQIAGVAFAAFIANSTGYPAIYSGLAILVLFLLWLYYAWLVVLVGAEVAYFHQHPGAYLAFRRRPSHLFRERMALASMIEIARRHLAGRPLADVDGLSLGLNVPLAALEDLVDEFVRHGLLLRAAEPRGIALGRPPEQISIVEILDVVQEPDALRAIPRGEPLESGAHALNLRDQAVQSALEGLTLRSVIPEPVAVKGSPSVVSDAKDRIESPLEFPKEQVVH
jgi:membrane protein